MPNVEKTPRQTVRIDPDKWEAFGAHVGGRDRGRVIREFIDWTLRQPGGRLPDRASRELARDIAAAANEGGTIIIGETKPDA